MRYHFFLHYGWFFQNLEKDFIPILLHTTVNQTKFQFAAQSLRRKGPIILGVEFWGKFKKPALGRLNLRNASNNLRNAEHSNFIS